DALTAFTDAGRKSMTAAVTWQRKEKREKKVLQAGPGDSLQTMELLAVVWAMLNLREPLNIVTDSLYVAGVTERIEEASIKEVQNPRLYELFL
ncbi:POK11 protein, partial [Urocolius indicus]|nr:POK11 protein [Urocolius indicus]